MSSAWHVRYTYPKTFPTEPMDPLNPKFDQSFIRLNIYNDLDPYLNNIEAQKGKFWISSDTGGLGKSTMLRYITRYLYKQLPVLKALPFRLSVPKEFGVSVKHTFILDFLNAFLTLDLELEKAAELGNFTLPQNMKWVANGFGRYRDQIRAFQKNLPTLSLIELDHKFKEIIDEALLRWKEQGIFSKYVLLIDEMDKIPVDEVLTFLSGNQDLFQDLYNNYGFVAFFAGHDSWVQRIHSGTEYRYWKGDIFRVPPFVDIQDVARLVQIILTSHTLLLPSDNPWTEDGYAELMTLTAGNPSNIILNTAQVMNEAYRVRSSEIGSGLVREVLVTAKFEKEVIEHLRTHTEVYLKLKRAIAKRAYFILPLYYFANPDHRIAKSLDNNLSLRTETLGLEVSDEEWTGHIRTLMEDRCLKLRGEFRELAVDVETLFDKFHKQREVLQKLIPDTVRTAQIEPRIAESTPDLDSVIDQILDRDPTEWLSKESIFVPLSEIVRTRNPTITLESTRKSFEKVFATHVKKFKLMSISEDSEMLYRKPPLEMEDDDRIILKLNLREIIDEYIDLVLGIKDCNQYAIDRIDGLFHKIIYLLCSQRRLQFDEKAFQTRRKRQLLFRQLELPNDLRNRIEYYLSETRGASPAPSIIKETAKHIVRGLAGFYVSFKPEISIIGDRVTIFVGQMNKADATIHKWFEGFTGDVIGILMYIDPSTFGYLDSIPKSCGIRIITSHVRKPIEKCVKSAEKCAANRPHFEIIKIDKMHSRWIGSKDSFFVDIGTDLKSDGLGHTNHTIVKVAADAWQEEIAKFEDLWGTSSDDLNKKYGEDLKKSVVYPPSSQQVISTECHEAQTDQQRPIAHPD